MTKWMQCFIWLKDPIGIVRCDLGWRFYLREKAGKPVSPYASPIHQKNFSSLPPAYTFVGSGEPFYAETLEYVRKLKEAGIKAADLPCYIKG